MTVSPQSFNDERFNLALTERVNIGRFLLREEYVPDRFHRDENGLHPPGRKHPPSLSAKHVHASPVALLDRDGVEDPLRQVDQVRSRVGALLRAHHTTCYPRGMLLLPMCLAV